MRLFPYQPRLAQYIADPTLKPKVGDIQAPWIEIGMALDISPFEAKAFFALGMMRRYYVSANAVLGKQRHRGFLSAYELLGSGVELLGRCIHDDQNVRQHPRSESMRRLEKGFEFLRPAHLPANANVVVETSIQPIAHIDCPSPFTRCGPGVNNAIKPEVCEYGGNALWWGRHRQIQADSGLGIVSTNIDFRDSLFATQIGTSLAAPRVAHLAAKILQLYPGISANLVRALIANAASVPDAVRELLDHEDDILKVCGYGKPDADRALFSADNRVTLIADESIALDTINLYEIPIPEEFQQLNGTRLISVSLAYDAPVRNTRADYLGVKMSFRLFRGIELEQIVDWFAERSDNPDPDAIEDRYKCKMDPSPKRRETSTLQKAVFKASQNRSFIDYANDTGSFYLLVTCQAGWASPEEFEEQRYGLAVSIEHLDAPIQLYELVSQRIQSRERIRVRR